ncbi:MAG: ABC transporter permease subunit [Lachnospiraceae bacterium]|nr:ABC transporter permease subunit [Lachnospiraceae bacterium]
MKRAGDSAYKKSRAEIIKTDFKRNKVLYFLFIPVLVYFIIFHYIPMAGVFMAFEDYNIKKGLFGSDLVGFAHFLKFFRSQYFIRVLRNTLLISFYGLLFSFPFPIIFALCLNEVRRKGFKKAVQTISYLPYFISVVVVVSILFDFTKSGGVLTNAATALGWKGGALISSPKWFRTLFIGSNIWQHLGYSAIIYISALSGIDPELYDAAKIDGAGRWKQTLYITLPGIASTIVVLLILRMGSIMSVGYEKIILMYKPATYETADVISSYVYRVGLIQANYSYSTAINLFNSVVNFIVLAVANKLGKKISGSGLW